MPRALLAVPLVLAALASGCTGGSSSASDFEGEEAKVAEVVEELQSAGETGDAGKICDDILARQLRDQIQEAGATCEQELDKAIKDADDFELDVEAVTIQGNSATAKVKGQDQGEERVRDFEFVREGEDWRATNLGS
jgi:uncharacterized cupredoxin-like copper-binding protein